MLKDCFKAVYGKPVHAFRREYKMQVATKLLTTTDMSITELAGEFGYENPKQILDCVQRSDRCFSESVSGKKQINGFLDRIWLFGKEKNEIMLYSNLPVSED